MGLVKRQNKRGDFTWYIIKIDGGEKRSGRAIEDRRKRGAGPECYRGCCEARLLDVRRAFVTDYDHSDLFFLLSGHVVRIASGKGKFARYDTKTECVTQKLE